MIGQLPKQIDINGRNYSIRSDFRPCLGIIKAYTSNELNYYEKIRAALTIFYEEFPKDEDVGKAIEKMVWFLDCGKTFSDKDNKSSPKLMDWGQDEQYIFAGISAVVNRDVREDGYCHWWTFCGLYMSIDGNSTFSTIVHIRKKIKKQGFSKLEKWEKEFYSDNIDAVDLQEGSEENFAILELLRGEGDGEC